MRTRNKLEAIAAIAIVGSNVLLARSSFYISHAVGDERAYVAVAMKIGRRGFGGYSMKGIDIVPRGDFVEYRPAGRQRGSLLEMYEAEGTPFYDQPLFHSPPLFPALIAVSHAVFAPEASYRVVAAGAAEAEDAERHERISAQFYCCIVPIAASALLALLCFLLGRTLFSGPAGLFAAVLLSMSPINIIAGRRIWADSTLAFLVTAALLFCYLYAMRGRFIYMVMSAFSLGAALLTKNSALIAIIPLAFYCWCVKSRGGGDRGIRRLAPVGIILLAFLVAAPWYRAVAATFGTPLFNPSQPGISKTHPWFAFINARPWYTYVVGIPYQVPLFLLGYYKMAMLLVTEERRREDVFLALWFLSFLAGLTVLAHASEMLGPDHRYMLPAYPALAVLSGSLLEEIRRAVNEKGRRGLGNALAIILITGSLVWTLRIVAGNVHRSCIPVPF